MQIISPNEYSPFRSEIKRCPKCSSVFVDHQVCESCGLQLAHNPLGEPLGEKSYYGLVEQYWQSVSPMGVRLSIMESPRSARTQKYRRALVHRYQQLIVYFLNAPADYTQTQHKQLFLVELGDLVKEMVRLRVPAAVFWQPLEACEGGLSTYLYQVISKHYESAEKLLLEMEDLRWNKKKYFGLIDFSMALRIGMFVILLTSLGYALMNFLALR